MTIATWSQPAHRGGRSRALLSIAALAALLCGCPGGEVVRVIDGVEVPGRFVSDWAYASYARGVEWEQRQQFQQALRFYQAAAASDPDSAEVWTRIGALQCRLEVPAESAESFERAEVIDASYEPLWRARARCAEAAGRTEVALSAAARAASLDPQRDDTALLYARLLDSARRHREAASWLRDVSLRSPFNERVWEAIEAHASARGDDAWLREARRQLRSLRERRRPDPPPADWQAVDAALVGGSLATARKRLRQARLDPRLLAARAVVVGRPALALEEAELRLGANPADGDARVAVALAADLLGDSKRASEALRQLPSDTEPLSQTARLLLAELLERHVGKAAALDWLGATEDKEDSLRQQLRQSFEPQEQAQ